MQIAGCDRNHLSPDSSNGPSGDSLQEIPVSIPASALDAKTQTFPILTPAQVDRLRSYGHVRKVEAGEILFDVGASVVPFYVLLSGTLEIVQPGLAGERRIVTH